MSIYIDNGKTVKHYCTSNHKRIEEAIQTLLESIEDIAYSETHEGYGIRIVDKESDEE